MSDGGSWVIVGEPGPELPMCTDPVITDAACPNCGWQHVRLEP